MSDALTQIYAMQQQERNEQERARLAAQAKRNREGAAFRTSGIPALYMEFAAVPLRSDVQSRTYKKTVAEMTWQHCDPRVPANANIREMTFSSHYSGDNNPRWWCEEIADSGRMIYFYAQNGNTSARVYYNEPNGPWLAAFVEYLAKICDPDAIAEKMRTRQAPENLDNPSGTRRQLQPL
jgi:hypothetical protein